MPKKPQGRPNTPSENANIAPAAGVRVVRAALAYLADPDGADRDHDLTGFVEPLKAALAELEEMEPSYSRTEKVRPEDVEVFGRADKAAEAVMTQTRADDVHVRIHHHLLKFRTLWQSAATGV